jgi:integrase
VDSLIGHVLAAGKRTETAGHVQKVVSAMIEHARSLQQFTGENPAQLVDQTERIPVRRPHAMTVQQCQQLLAAVEDVPANPQDRRSNARPMRTMSLLGICCSLGVSEQLGLQWQYVNLTKKAELVNGETIEPFSVALREHCYHGRTGSLKHGHRRRIVPIPTVLVEALTAIRKQTKWNGPEDPVFAGVGGKPIWADNLAKRVLKPIANALNMPWLSLHVFRHTCGTLTKSYGMIDVDRRVLMGHADENMTDRYTHEDFERMRSKIEMIAAEVTKRPEVDAPETAAQPRTSKVVQIGQRAVGRRPF